ncbi:hypothetical protein SAMN04489712_101257 [Thermomonospora echinospora]|uniref:Cell division protein FtsL n=1 Tax=Thermomonospora echinospora TaxID=1992 RepID=A0A1H5SKV2_9ACTN|nr:hypothetical protein [Thermomonospora echinospora]SEF51216.1 hypothetical protein SAMN04489712_101257 [Thermomonospora echinospora]
MTTTTGSRSRPAERPARSRRAVPRRSAGGRPADPPVRPGGPGRAEDTDRVRPAGPVRRPSAPPRTPFVLLIVALLSGALVSLLLLNTVLAQDAFELTRLQRSVKLLDQERQALESDIAREESPERLARKAENLGMEPSAPVAFVDPHTRRVVGGAAQPVPHDAAAAAGAAGALGVPGALIPGDGVIPAATRP